MSRCSPVPSSRGHNDGLSHAGKAEEGSLDFADLDTVAADFDLEVLSPLQFETTVGVHPTHVARAKDALRPTRRVAQEGSLGEVWLDASNQALSTGSVRRSRLSPRRGPRGRPRRAAAPPYPRRRSPRGQRFR